MVVGGEMIRYDRRSQLRMVLIEWFESKSEAMNDERYSAPFFRGRPALKILSEIDRDDEKKQEAEPASSLLH